VLLDSNLLQNLGISTTQGGEIPFKLIPDAASGEAAVSIVDASEDTAVEVEK
jgi:hypothetical protein